MFVAYYSLSPVAYNGSLRTMCAPQRGRRDFLPRLGRY
jgi:hypothetical protein